MTKTIKTKIYSYGLIAIATIASLACATTKSIPTLKGSYVDAPYTIKTTSSYDQVWSKLIDLFATKGIAIKIIDKSSGLITSEPVSFSNSYATENSKGEISSKKAFVVIPKITDGLGRVLEPNSVSGDWNVRIKATEGGTTINVNLVNLKCFVITPPSQYSKGYSTDYPIKSTGVFEQLISDDIK